MENSWWYEKELLNYFVPESLLLDRKKRLWYYGMVNHRLDNLDQVFNLEQFTERVDWRLEF